MYSGGDSSGEGVNSHNQFNWQMTSQTSCNINSGSIDWASLAQQWIQMKDSGAGLPEAPPPPIISSSSVNFTKSIKQPSTTKFDEQGEADMEVEKDDELQIIGFDHNSPQPPQADPWVPLPPIQQLDAESYCPPQQNWSWPARVALPPPILHVPMTTGSLTPPITKDIIARSTPPLQKPSTDMVGMLTCTKGVAEIIPMDAAKRKILPAWIREGLEKMEREKQKQLERTTKDKDPISAGTSTGEVDENDINNFKSMVKNSIMEMEGESSGNEDANNTAEPVNDNDDDTEAVSVHPANILSTNDSSENILNSGKTYEEKIADMMIGVRKTLTELLLEVTNEEIVILANEAIRRRREKASSVQVIRKSAIPSITGKLGLEAYADSDSDNSGSDNDTTNDESKRTDDDYDSEEEIKSNIRTCQRTFLKTIEEIEEKIEASTVRDDFLLRQHRKDEIKNEEPRVETTTSLVQQKNIKRFDKDIGEPLQPEKKSNTNGKRKKERTSRFSDNKDSRSRNIGTSFYQPSAMGSGSLPSQSMPGALPVPPASNFSGGDFKSRTGNSSAVSSPIMEKRCATTSSSSMHKSSKHTSSSSSTHHRRRSDSSTSSLDSSSSSTSSAHSRRSKYSSSRRKQSSKDRSKRSSHKSTHRSSSHRSGSHRSGRRRASSDSNDDNDHYRSKRSSSSYRRHQHKSHSSSKYSSSRDNRRRSDSRSSRSRTRSRSRSRSTTYSSSRRGGDRY